MKFHCHQYWLLLSPHNPRDPSVTSKTGEEAMLSGGPCWSPLLLSRLVAAHWISVPVFVPAVPVFLCLQATPGCGTAYQGWKPHTFTPTPTTMKLVVMMTVKPYTILIHAVISARNMRAILELTFHLFLTIVSFSLSLLIALPFSCISAFILSLGFPESLSYYLFFWNFFFPGNPPVPSWTHSVGLPHIHHSGTLHCTPESNPLFLGYFPLSRFDFSCCWSTHSNNF